MLGHELQQCAELLHLSEFDLVAAQPLGVTELRGQRRYLRCQAQPNRGPDVCAGVGRLGELFVHSVLPGSPGNDASGDNRIYSSVTPFG